MNKSFSQQLRELTGRSVSRRARRLAKSSHSHRGSSLPWRRESINTWAVVVR